MAPHQLTASYNFPSYSVSEFICSCHHNLNFINCKEKKWTWFLCSLFEAKFQWYLFASDMKCGVLIPVDSFLMTPCSVLRWWDLPDPQPSLVDTFLLLAGAAEAVALYPWLSLWWQPCYNRAGTLPGQGYVGGCVQVPLVGNVLSQVEFSPLLCDIMMTWHVLCHTKNKSPGDESSDVTA